MTLFIDQTNHALINFIPRIFNSVYAPHSRTPTPSNKDESESEWVIFESKTQGDGQLTAA